MMDDLAAELRLRGFEPPYLAVEQELADCSAQTKETERKKVLKAFAREMASSCKRTKGRSIRSDVARLVGWSEGLSGHWIRLCERSHTTGPACYALYSTVSSAWATSIERATVPTR